MGGQTFTNLAKITIKIDGQPIDVYERNLEEAVVESVFNLPAMATIRLQDPNLEFVDDSKFDIGKQVEIDMTPPASFDTGTEKTVVFKGEIVALEPSFTSSGTQVLVVRAYDKAHRLFLMRRTQTYEKMTDDAIVKKIAGELGLAVDADAAQPQYEYVLQYNQTDMEFLSERARRIGYLLYVKDGKLLFKKPSTRVAGPTLVLGETLRSFQPRLSAAQQPNTFETRGWDPIKKQLIAGTYTSQSGVWTGNGVSKSGGATAKSAFMSDSKTYAVDSYLVDSNHAKAMATADGEARAGDFIEGDGVAYLSPKIMAGVEITLNGLGTRFSGKYFVTSATHYYNAQGGETHFTVTGRYPHTITDLIRPEKDRGQHNGRIDGVVPAIVTNLRDPQGLIRVRVKFPWMPPDSTNGEIESAWAKIAAPDAGPERGFVYMPEVNDEVLVAFEHGDVNRPYIVGRVWNSKDKSPEAQNALAPNGKVERRVYYSRTKHMFIIDDSQNAPQILLQDSKGNQLFVDTKNDSITIKAARDITIDAGANITIKAGQKITLDAGMDIIGTAKAKMDFTANAQYNVKSAMVAIKSDGVASFEATGAMNLKSTGPATLQSSAILNVMGTLVKIN